MLTRDLYSEMPIGAFIGFLKSSASCRQFSCKKDFRLTVSKIGNSLYVTWFLLAVDVGDHFFHSFVKIRFYRLGFIENFIFLMSFFKCLLMGYPSVVL